ncbi:UDP-N-acetylmuramoyl-L-alanyl-D-glutamate--2,6-diaminopimelate ligase [Aliarcobacter thereius]|uniref:UDP-N-acetylmuramoyl-L-alanyl-D-glutamate--2, 6-diaminopimelate ligase n=1 Tax=Aliarcobacter thereius TaxID=544718 RepID=A0A1C0B914_9BACT|nr:UDP-N-acetylmuramoyl-L-alanyl-D-glutamate--2,6-diaminopimelate ligase [Aliarcobacter thereius]OCL88781.1 UDP-N-acetylmuramoyl-L-alanyl-D-glutamate--2,6-diaminopimelate ligase [Aliarcobacter thereius]OCM00074.1 UDP-N-acetylmuramoyl-L-alanyl-D-glutamate--2,6-diaminopimelate ligase [Aliarcobacter thereius]
MKLIIKDKIFTDNTNDLEKDSIFVVSKQNSKFENIAKDGGFKTIYSNELKNYLDMSSIKIIGVTGTNGKTTTATTIYNIFLALGYKVALQGTRGFFINGVQEEEYSLTTPVQIGNFLNIQKAINKSCEFFIMEVSSHAIEQNRIEGLKFALKIHTNITRDHLDYHKTVEEYINIKNLFLSDESLKLVNIDDKVLKYNPKNAYTYSIISSSNFKVDSYNLENMMKVEFINENKKYNFSSKMLGVFNIYNLMASISAVKILTKNSFEEICETLKNYGGVSGRVEIVSLNPLVIVDFAHTPDGMEEVLKSFPNKDIICVFGAGGNRDSAKRPLMGEIAEKYSKHIVVTSDNPRFEDPKDIIKNILSGIKNKINVLVEENRKEAIKKAISLANENSVVLVLGKGDEATQIIGNEKIHFSDKEEILNILNK